MSTDSVVLYAEINIFSIIVLLIVAIGTWSASVSAIRRSKIFLTSVCFALIANIFDMLWKIGAKSVWNFPLWLMLLVNFLYFLCFALSSWFWFLYSEEMTGGAIFKHKNLLVISAVPVVLLIVLLVISAFTGCLFYFDEDMTYHRGKLYALQAILSYGYIAVAAVKNLILYPQKKSYAHRDDLMSTILFAIIVMIFGLAQGIFQNAPLATLGIVTSYLIAYIRALKRLISVDPLTGIGNRRDLLNRMETQYGTIKKDEKLCFLFMDIDSFKSINDTYGHNEGDRVLRAVAKSLRKICDNYRGSCCARFGGDEFVMVVLLGIDESGETVAEQVRDAVHERASTEALSVSISVGCREYLSDATKSVVDILADADEAMYEEKAKNKKATDEN